jgi:hypothetical protein
VRGFDRRVLLPLAGSAVLAAFSVAALPFSRGLLRAPQTPYDASDAAYIAVPQWIVLQKAASLIPPGASVVVRSEPPDPTTDSFFHRFAVALLPNRRIVPAARWGLPSEPILIQEAEYEIVIGRPPSAPPGRLLLETREGTVWRHGG